MTTSTNWGICIILLWVGPSHRGCLWVLGRLQGSGLEKGMCCCLVVPKPKDLHDPFPLPFAPLPLGVGLPASLN